MKKIILLISLISLIVCSASAYPAHNYDISDSTLDTTPTAEDAKDDQEAMGYSGYSDTNLPASDAYSDFEDDAIFFFNGHGLTYDNGVKGGGIIFGSNSLILGQDDSSNYPGNSRYYIEDYGGNDLEGVLLAVYLSCYSSHYSQYHGNLAWLTVGKGADVCIGFDESIIESKSCYWSEQFWEHAKDGETIADAADDAKNDCYWQYPYGYHGIDSYQPYVETSGNSDNYLTPARYGA